MDLGIRGLKAIVLGGSRGIGAATCRLLAQEGADVAFCARGAEGVAAAAEQYEALGNGRICGQATDLADEAATRDFVRVALHDLGGVDMLIHNASGFGLEDDEESWARAFQVDMMGAVRAVDECIEALKASSHASITLIGSMASKFFFGRRGAYGPAKGAMRVYANELAQDLGQHGIRANAVSPGAVWFKGGAWDRIKQDNPKLYAAVEKRIPLGRLGTDEELARIITFVASPAGLWINGAHIAADGGQVAAVD